MVECLASNLPSFLAKIVGIRFESDMDTEKEREDEKEKDKENKEKRKENLIEEEGADVSETEVKPKITKKIKYAIIAVVSITLVGGLGGGYFLLHRGAKAGAVDEQTVEKEKEEKEEEEKEKEEESKEDSKEESKEDNKEEKEEGGDAEGKHGKSKFYSIEPPFVVNIQSSDRSKFLQIKVEIMAKSNRALKAVEANIPLIKNDLITLFSSQTIEQVTTPQGKENLRKEAIKKVNAILEQESDGESVDTVLFTSFVMQ